jgi:two-component system cell cycle sensor histidine kinase/response regulator CckA
VGSETILVVDDEPGVQELVRIILSRQGYKILVADSGPKAIEIYGQTDAAIDLLVTDVVMPA